MLTIRGQQVDVMLLVYPLSHAATNCQIASSLTDDFREAPDEVTRTHQVAANFSANTGMAMGKLILGLLEVGNGYAVELSLNLSNTIFLSHKAFKTAYDEQCAGKSPVLPSAEELESRRAGLKERLAAANEALDAVKFAMGGMACEDERRLAGEIFVTVLERAAQEAVSSVTFALGEFKVEMSDEELKSLVDQVKEMLMGSAGMSEEEAEAQITAKAGDTPEKRKAAFIAQQMAPLMVDSQGTKDGALLAAGSELKIIEEGVAMLSDFINKPLPVYEKAEAEVDAEVDAAAAPAHAEAPTEAPTDAPTDATPAAASPDAPKSE